MELSQHAKYRCQERNIPPLILEWLNEFGSVGYDKHGCKKIFFDKKSRHQLSENVGKEIVERMGDLMNIYMVVDNDNYRVITAGHRHKRFKF